MFQAEFVPVESQAAQARAVSDDHPRNTNSGHGANIRVCMGIFSIGFRRYKYWKVLNNIDRPCF